MSTPQGTAWTPGDDPVPPSPGVAPPPAAPWQSLVPPPPAPRPGGAPPPAAPWPGSAGGQAGGGFGSGVGPPEVTTVGTGAPTHAPDPYAAIDPFRTDGTSVLRTPPAAPGAQYHLDAPPNAWGPPPVWAPPPRTDGIAITSLVLGIIGILVFPLVLAQAAVVLGIVGVRRVRRSGDQGFALAVAGIVLGALGTLFVVAFVGLFASLAWWGL
jgi:hypothetical protein